MFETAELGHKISKEAYDKEVPKLRKALLDVQLDLRTSSQFQVIILIGGVDGAGRGQTVKLLNEWMDARFIETNAMSDSTQEEDLHPPMWKFWRLLPPKGKIGIFFGSWYTEPIIDRVYKRTNDAELNKTLDNIVKFERMLFNEGTLILKFWFHLSKINQRKRLKKIEKNPEKYWLSQRIEWEHFKHYDKFVKTSKTTLMHTSTAEAPWTIVEATDPRFRNLTVARSILTALKSRLADKAPKPSSVNLPAILPAIDNKILLQSLDHTQRVSQEKYDSKLIKLQKRLRLLIDKLKLAQIPLVIVFEGVDAAGKGSAIRRITNCLDPRYYRIRNIAAPTEEEKMHPYLWRFWRKIPMAGEIVVFDRSWYGRVLVEKIEGFCSESDWKRAYSEINDFEKQVTENGVLMIKFWLSITKDEQLKRFHARKKVAFKHFKITDEDWRNRRKWGKYELAVEEMIARTSTVFSPWHIIEANDKHFAHLKILNNLCMSVEAIL